MYYTEQELYEYNVGTDAIIKLYFNNFNLVSPILVEDSMPEPTMQISALTYDRVLLKNCKHSELYVMRDLVGKFKEIYFPER